MQSIFNKNALMLTLPYFSKTYRHKAVTFSIMMLDPCSSIMGNSTGEKLSMQSWLCQCGMKDMSEAKEVYLTAFELETHTDTSETLKSTLLLMQHCMLPLTANPLVGLL